MDCWDLFIEEKKQLILKEALLVDQTIIKYNNQLEDEEKKNEVILDISSFGIQLIKKLGAGQFGEVILQHIILLIRYGKVT